MSLRVLVETIQAPTAWDHTQPWYRTARGEAECLDPDTPKRVPGCHCRLCESHLTDPALVGPA